MNNGDILFEQFVVERNVKDSTRKGYLQALKSYTRFTGLSLEELIAEALEDEGKSLKDRRLKQRLVDYRGALLKSTDSENTVKTYFTKVKTFYKHFDIEIPSLPSVKMDKVYETCYLDLPTRDHIRSACDISSVGVRSVILFMSSSGSAKAETLSLTVGDFIKATEEYHNTVDINQALCVLSEMNNVVPTFYLKRQKTDKYYYTFCSPEASNCIVSYLLTRGELVASDSLFDFSDSQLLNRFQEINDSMKWGFKGKYRFFRSHALRKFHASNIGLETEYVDALQGRGKDATHEAYIKTNPKKLREIYLSAMDNILIYKNSYENNKVVVGDGGGQDFTIVVNVFLSGMEYNII